MVRKGLIFYVLLFPLLLMACGNGVGFTANKKLAVEDSLSNANAEKFKVLQFMADDKPFTASISTKYQNFSNKKSYPLSVFITVNYLGKLKDTVSIEKDKLLFDKIEREILVSLSSFSYCYIGHTNMNSYRDLMFYIKPLDQKKFSLAITKIKNSYPQIKSFVFENDPEWEAVSDFYIALKN